MPAVKDKIECLFKKLGYLLYQNPLKALFLVILSSAALIYQIPRISFDSSPEGFLKDKDPDLLEYRTFRNQFGQPDLIVIAVTPPEVFEGSFLSKLKAFHDDLKREVPHLRNITSLINARRICGEGDKLVIEKLLEGWPKKEMDFSSLKRAVLRNPAYLNYVISEDGKTTALVLETVSHVAEINSDDLLSNFEEDIFVNKRESEDLHYLSGKEIREVTEAIDIVADRYRSRDFPLSISGAPFIFDFFDRYQMKDGLRCMVLSSIVVIFFLGLLFRNVPGVLLPWFIVILDCFSVLGLMVVFNIPIKMTTMVMPAFLLAVGVADSVHVLAIFFRSLQRGSSKEDAIAFALGHSGLAIVMTSLTTAAGLLSFSLAKVTAIAEMGIFSAAGVILALLYTIIMLPALLTLVSIKPRVRQQKGWRYMDRVLLSFAHFSSAHSTRIVLASLTILAISGALTSRLRFFHDAARFFPDQMAVKKDLTFIDRELKGILTLEVVIDTKKKNGVYDPEILNRIEDVSYNIGKIKNPYVSVGKIFSINDIIKETNQALHENNTIYYTIPQDRRTIAQELLLFENTGSDDLERMVDNQFRKTRITIKTSWVGAVVGNQFREYVERQFRDAFQNNADISITGMLPLLARTFTAALHSMAKSYVIAFVVIAVMMVILMRNLKIGLLAMIPNLLPICMVLGVMGLVKIPMDMNSLMIGSIALGLVVDDTVHFMHNFQKYYEKTGSTQKAVQETLLGTGRAMLITSLVLAAGFFILMGASLKHMVRFGFLTGVVILIALLSDFLLAPALMMLATCRRKTTLHRCG